ncbi:MAG: TIGR03915 family putative DNA repair protein [Bacteroidales bacterium]|nr:TIGR03915 family putative DNA repair protein [Bacteroidales bacterium]
MTVYTFDGTMDGLLTAVFDAFDRHEQPESLLTAGEALPLFCDEVHEVTTEEEKAHRVWSGMEKRLSAEALRLISVSMMSELPELNHSLFNYICKTFRLPEKAKSIERNYADPDVQAVVHIARKVLHEQLRMKQFVRFQKAKDGTYLAVISPDHNVLPLVIGHFQDRFNDQPWMMYDAKRHYGYYYEGQGSPMRITFEDETSVPFSLADGRLNDEKLNCDDVLFQELWRTYFKAICIRERLNPRKQRGDMPIRYWKYMTEKQK